LSNAAAEQVRPLVDACSHQQAAIAAALDDQLLRRAVPLMVQVLSTSLQQPAATAQAAASQSYLGTVW
jgi:hypothetical protein